MSSHPLQDQSAVVTGASSGIGKAIAIAFAEAGAAVVVNYRSDEASARDVVSSVEQCGGRALAVQADISKEEDCEALFEQATNAFGRIDILIANAGIQRDKPFLEMTLVDWQTVIDVNLTGQFLCAREAARRFCRQTPSPASARGKIIFTSSVHQAIPWAGRANYAAAKGGLKLLMETIAQELAGQGIRVNALAPGAIRTPINRDAWETDQARKDLLEKIPYRRLGEPEDVARAAVWLASDAADYVVGATLVVDGGMMLYPAFAEGG